MPEKELHGARDGKRDVGDVRREGCVDVWRGVLKSTNQNNVRDRMRLSEITQCILGFLKKKCHVCPERKTWSGEMAHKMTADETGQPTKMCKRREKGKKFHIDKKFTFIHLQKQLIKTKRATFT